MKYIILFILSFFWSNSMAKSCEIEKIIREASSLIVPKDFKYFNLVDSSFTIDLRNNAFSEYNTMLSEFIEENPDFDLNEILSFSENAEKLNWHNYQIDKARLYSYDDIPKFATHVRMIREVSFKTSKLVLDSLNNDKKYNEVIVPVKRWWSKRRKGREADLKWEERAKNTTIEDTKYFLFSTPIISPDNKYAIMELIIGGERGVVCVFKREDNQWVILDAIGGFVY